ncbi:MAG: UDP-N-acetylmuramoyl-L-alanyl-D-glutamate--2,6-diaminopimelate ligase, partial [Oscillospiraceae bacterium]|nr:UDP-N-acetylmuramoyl-L-alanyl-D-glutamate--2,6-diaminopimelate ligase [Oscillospiraceae bacterium]
ILADIEVGLKKTTGKYIVVPDRKRAIKYCIDNAQKGDVVVLAGKGHEDYQEIKGVKYPFDERDVIHDILQEEGKLPAEY